MDNSLASFNENALSPPQSASKAAGAGTLNGRMPLAPIDLNVSSSSSSSALATPTKKTPSLVSKLLAWGSSSKYPPRETAQAAAAREEALDDMLRYVEPVGSIVSPPRPSTDRDDAVVPNPRRQLLLTEDEEEDAYVDVDETASHPSPDAVVSVVDEGADCEEDAVPRCRVGESETVDLAFEDEDEEEGLEEEEEEVEEARDAFPCSKARGRGTTAFADGDNDIGVALPSVSSSGSSRRRSSVGFQLASNKETLRALSRRRVSMELCLGDAYGPSSNSNSTYGSEDSSDEAGPASSGHVPLYSQAELDARVEEAGRGAQLEIDRLAQEVQSLRHNAAAAMAAPAPVHSSIGVADQLAEELAMQKIQTKALALELKNLHERLVSQEAEHRAALTALREEEAGRLAQAVRATNREALDKTAVVVRECEARLAAQQAALAESEAQRVVLAEEVAALRARVASAEAERAGAVEEVRAKVYEKAQRQFEEGNREYQRVLRELKDSKTQCERAVDDCAILRAEAVVAREAVGEAEAANRALVLELDGVKAAVTRVLAAAGGDLGGNDDAHSRLRAHEVYLEAQRVTIQQLEAGLASASVAAEEAARRVQAEVDAREGVEQALGASNALHCAAQQQLAALEAERGTNLALIARLVTSKDASEAELDKLRQDLGAANERCTSLRAMNEELLSMLEGGAQ